MLEIADIAPGSAALGLNLKRGDRILAINRSEVNDVIDYQFLVADPHITIRLTDAAGRTRTISVDKDPDDTLGLSFAPLAITRCGNKCVFCFVDQMPPGCRKSLYVKDDDFRASFLYGNYITLGALSEADWRRIFAQRLSPLYISVHATDPALRTSVLRNQKAPDIMASLTRMAAGGIRMHTQIVLCPELNDDRHLQKTLEDLAGLFPAVSSIAVVPVGLTAFRKGLFPLRAFTRGEARAVIEQVTRFGDLFKRRHGTRLAFASDEFYIKAKAAVPPVSFYEDFPQIENGVGMTADFLRDAGRTRLPAGIAPLSATVVTGASFGPLLKDALARLRRVEGLSLRLVVAGNLFFGPSVTVAGLLTGSDIAAALAGKRKGAMVLIPAAALNEEETLFLDGMRLEELEAQLGVRVLPVQRLRDILTLMRKEGRRTSR